MRRSLSNIGFLATLIMVAACSDTTGPVAMTAAPSERVAGTPAGSVVPVSISSLDAIACGGVADVTITASGRDEQRPLDVVVLMDASAGIGSANWTLMKQRVSALIDAFQWSATGNRMALVQFSGYAITRHPFGSPQSVSALKGTANALAYSGGQSWMRTAVQRAIEQYDEFPRANSTKVVILITDGNPNPLSTQEPCALASQLASRGVKTLVFGMGTNWTSANVTCLVTDPATQIFAPERLGEMNAALAAQVVSQPSVKAVTISSTIGSGFSIEGTPVASAGTVSLSGSTLTWSMSELGSQPQTVTLRIRATSASGAQAPAMTGSSVRYTLNGTTTIQQMGDLAIDVASCDVTPPAIVADVTGTLGSEGWYVSNVSVAWHVSDGESAFTILEGCTASSVTTDTNGQTFGCSASSLGGTQSASTTIRRDATTPVITFTGNASTYSIGNTVAITCVATDAMSGIASSDCPSVNAGAWTFGPGTHTLRATAVDVAGNVTNRSVTFSVSLTYQALCDMTRAWVSDGQSAIKLCHALELAESHALRNRGRGNPANEMMENYIKWVGKEPSISTAQRATLIGLAREL